MTYPIYFWALVMAGVVGIPALTAVGLDRGVSAVASRRLAAGVALGFAAAWSAWVVTSGVLAERGAYQQLPDVTQPWIGVAAGGAVVALLAAGATPLARAAFAAPRSLAALAWPQVVRVVGVVFVIALAMHRLPAAFALPAGLGDIAVGLAAPFVARRLARGDRSGAVWFNVLGLADLVVAVTLGFLAGLGPNTILAVSPSTADVALLPLALVPTTAVPLAAALHVTSLLRLRRAAALNASPVTATG